MKEMAREIDGEAKRNVLMKKKNENSGIYIEDKNKRKVSSQKSVIPQCKIQNVRQHSRAHSGFRSARYHWRARPNCA